MFKDKVKELVNTEKICGVHLRMGFWRLVKNFMERENEGGSKEAHGGEMRKCKKQKRKKMHLEKCTRSNQKRIKIITKEIEIK